MQPVRVSKAVLTGSVALFMTLVVLNNLTDYGSNFEFVRHVLSMDTLFSGESLRWRALTHPVIHHVFYGTIILWEATTMVLCWMGAWRLWSARRGAPAEFGAAKGVAVAGLTLNLLLWMVAFVTVGGEWFAMWQSKTWNGQDAAFRMFTMVGLILLWVAAKEEA